MVFGHLYNSKTTSSPSGKIRKNILQGELSFNLEYGRGTVGNIWIKHDKNHLSKSSFRLGVMIDDCSFEIKEAVTDPFEAKDQRIELLCKRLENEKIMNVKDFLDRLFSNPVALQKIYGSNGKRWEVTIRHAKTAICDNKSNVSGSVGSNTREPDVVSVVDHNGCTEPDVESYQQSPSSNDMMWMACDPFILHQNEYFL
ncbi:hypothetical protein L1987_07232 [Smallanthus sonchifolius]|uniref:Uncharacterized protein n=1 Tax=Smallanthus sonchifolius TaxID=185202 RepID=A0ACB9K0I9_9ASTR|nr:hypothetical protein L1987_07232 [Smallanthus sonchifolius]